MRYLVKLRVVWVVIVGIIFSLLGTMSSAIAKEEIPSSTTKIISFNKVNKTKGISPFQASTLITLGLPKAKKTADFFVEPLCPMCARLENARNQYISKAILSGKYRIRYHLLDFLNEGSASGTYSTRVNKSINCLDKNLKAYVKDDASTLNRSRIFLNYFRGLYSENFMPAENGEKDHTDLELTRLAEKSLFVEPGKLLLPVNLVSFHQSYSKCIVSNDTQKRVAFKSKLALSQLEEIMGTDGEVGTPTIIVGNTVVNSVMSSNFLS